MQNLFLGQIALKRPWVRGAHSGSPRLAGSSPRLGAIRCCRDAGSHKCFDDCKRLPGEGRDAERLYEIVLNQPSCVNGVPAGCPAPTPAPAPTPSPTPVVNTPPPSSGSKLNCCVVKGPGGNQIQRCYNEGCGLNWVSGEGIYPGVPECGADGRPQSCHTPTAATGQQPLQTQPLQQAPGPTQVALSPEAYTSRNQQMTNTSAGQMQTTQAQNPTGTAAGDPFRAVAPRTPVQAMPMPASQKTSQVPIAPPVQPPAQPQQEYGDCPEDAQPLERWAQACAMAHRR